MANFNFGIQAAKDVQVQHQQARDFGMQSQNAEKQPESVKNVAWPEPKGNKKQLIGTVLGIAAGIALLVVLSLTVH